MQNSVKLRAYAKLNLLHLVIGKRNGGFHEVWSVLQNVSLHDVLRIKKTRDCGIKVTWQPKDVFTRERDNLCYKAAKVFFQFTKVQTGVRISVLKRIPVGGGMGGGSADAAATLFGLCKLFDVKLSGRTLSDLSETLGSDVPFFLKGGTAQAKGRGEAVEPFPALPSVFFLVIFPGFSHSTKQVYGRVTWTHLTPPDEAKKMVKRMDGLVKTKNLSGLGACFHNDLQKCAGRKKNFVDRIGTKLMQAGGLGASMTGSGSCVFGMFENESQAKEAAKKFPGLKTWVVQPVKVGVQSL